MKIEIFSLAPPAFLSCWVAQAADIATKSKRANEFFGRCWHETVARYPVDESPAELSRNFSTAFTTISAFGRIRLIVKANVPMPLIVTS
jgi:hypothetical protein